MSLQAGMQDAAMCWFSTAVTATAAVSSADLV